MTTHEATEMLATQAAQHFTELVNGLVAIRRDACAEHGVTMTDDEIVASVRASILRLLDEGEA